MNPELIYLFDYLNSLIFTEDRVNKDNMTLIGINKKDPDLIIYGLFLRYKEQKGKRTFTKYKPLQAYLVTKQDNEYVYDEFENHEYEIKEFKF